MLSIKNTELKEPQHMTGYNWWYNTIRVGLLLSYQGLYKTVIQQPQHFSFSCPIQSWKEMGQYIKVTCIVLNSLKKLTRVQKHNSAKYILCTAFTL